MAFPLRLGQPALQPRGARTHQLDVRFCIQPRQQLRHQLPVFRHPVEVAQEHPHPPAGLVLAEVERRQGRHAVLHNQWVVVKGFQRFSQPDTGTLQGMDQLQLGMAAGLHPLAHLWGEELGVVVPLQQQQAAPPANALQEVDPLVAALRYGPLPDHQAVPPDRLVKVEGMVVDAHIPAPLLKGLKGLANPHRGPRAHGIHQHINSRGRLNHRQTGLTPRACHGSLAAIWPFPVQRYGGESLGESPRIVVLGSCKVGNYVKSTPLLRGLKQRWPAATVDFLGSGVTADFEAGCAWIDWRHSWDDSAPGAGLALQQALAQRTTSAGPVDLAINLDGFNPATQTLTAWLRPRYVAGGSLTANLRRELPWGELPQQRFLADPDWDSQAFLERYAGVFQSNYIAELFCRLAFVETDFHAIELPSGDPGFAVPDVLIHCTTARAAKLWPYRYWRQVVEACTARGISVGLVGSAPAAQRSDYHSDGGEEALLAATELVDLRGRTTLLQLAGACRQAAAVVSVDAGPMHIAAAVGAPTLAIVGNDASGLGASPIRLWLPRLAVLQRTVSSASCSACAENRYRNDGCLLDGHPCMAAVEPDQVLTWLAAVPQLSQRWSC